MTYRLVVTWPPPARLRSRPASLPLAARAGFPPTRARSEEGCRWISTKAMTAADKAQLEALSPTS